MGTNCESCCPKRPPRTPSEFPSDNRYDPEVINRNFNNFIFQDKFIDFVGDKYKLNDPVFNLLHKDERDILEKFYKSKKNEFQNNMDIFLKKQNLSFVNVLTKQIISNEGGREKLNKNIKNEIENIKMNNKLFKLDYLTVMIIGQTGVGKSCLVNNLLYNGKEIAEERDGEIGTKMLKPYKSKTLAHLRLIDTRGIELEKAFSVDYVGEMATEFIKE